MKTLTHIKYWFADWVERRYPLDRSRVTIPHPDMLPDDIRTSLRQRLYEERVALRRDFLTNMFWVGLLMWISYLGLWVAAVVSTGISTSKLLALSPPSFLTVLFVFSYVICDSRPFRRNATLVID